MKNFLYCATLALVMLVIPLAAEAQFPKPRPVAAETVAPAPAQVAPPVASSVSAPAAATSAGWTQDDILKWLAAMLGTIATTIFGKNSLFPPKSPAPDFSPPKTVTDLLSKIGDPATRQALDEHLLTIVQSGLPGAAVQAGLGAVLGVGPFAAQLEPLIRNVVIDILNKRAAGQ